MALSDMKNQKGMTFWEFVWGATLFIFICYALIVAIPPYLNNQKLNNALVSITEEPDISTMSRDSMLKILKTKLNIDYADTIINLDKAFQVKTISGRKQLTIDYELVVPVLYNINLLFDFENHIPVPAK